MTSTAWLPRQHGAWAMLAVPALVGMIRGGPEAVHALLLPAWLAAYLAFAAAGNALHARRRPTTFAPLLTYGGIALVLGIGALALRPELLVWAVAFAPLALVSLGASAARADRSLLNDAVTILAACLFALVAYQASGGALPPDPEGVVMAWVAAALFAYFFGTAFYVKTVIRERGNPAFHRLSVGYHAAWTLFWAGSGSLGVPIGPPTQVGVTVFFAVLTVRAAVLAGRSLRPLHVGLGEIVASLVLGGLALTW